MRNFKYLNYPNPAFRRKTLQNLNKIYEFEFLDSFELPEKYTKKIQVPFPYESEASLINDQKEHNYLAYKTTFNIDKKSNYILHFDGVDYECKIYINKKLVQTHKGGYTHFQILLNEELKLGENTLEVLVYDSYSKAQIRGKQRTKEENYSCFYTQQSGIIRNVYLEEAGTKPIKDILVSANKDGEITYKITLFKKNSLDLQGFLKNRGVFTLKISEEKLVHTGKIKLKEFELYSLENPILYDLKVTSPGQERDVVYTYFGFRTIETKKQHVIFNDKPIYLRMILDQGYYPKKLNSPETIDVLNDLKIIKELGFNGIRVHQTNQINSYYYICDVLGLMVWNEIPSTFEVTDESKNEIREQLPMLISQHFNSPSIIAHVLFNETWGVYDLKSNVETQNFVNECLKITKGIDKTRLVILNDGWFNLDKTDIVSLHEYEQDYKVFKKEYLDKKYVLTKKIINCNQFGEAFADNNSYHNQPILITEFGGVALSSSTGWGYGEKVTSLRSYKSRIKHLFDVIYNIDYVTGFCYTQLTDVEQEVNGLLTPDRQLKLKKSEIRKIVLGGKGK